VAAAAAVLLVVLVVAALARSRDDGGTPADTPESTTPSSAEGSPSTSPTDSPSHTPSESPSESPSQETVTVDKADYVGRPKDEARRALEDLGLKVDEQEVDNTVGAPADTVADVSPSGEVAPDETITLSVYGDPVTTESPTDEASKPGKGTDKGKGKK
jgi:serine/threonine-protein kinase